MTTRVRGPTAADTATGSMQKWPGSMSTGTGTAPIRCTAEEEEMKVNAGMITSSPGWTPSTSSPSSRAWVPLVTASAHGAPWNAANSRSNSSTSDPPMRHQWPLSSTRSRPSRS